VKGETFRAFSEIRANLHDDEDRTPWARLSSRET
jgi:hypothetical protein